MIDDQSRGSTTYAMYPDRLEINESLSSDDADFTHANVSSMSLTASDSFTALNVYGTPASVVPGNQTTVFLGGGNDAANVFPHDAAGNLTVTTNIGINGGSGTDTFTIQDAASPGAINYSFSNPFGSGTQNIFGMGTGGLGTATIENLVVNAGTGADTFDVNQYTSGTGLTINAGSGDDTLNFGNNNLPANIPTCPHFYSTDRAAPTRLILRMPVKSTNGAIPPWPRAFNRSAFSAQRTIPPSLTRRTSSNST